MGLLSDIKHKRVVCVVGSSFLLTYLFFLFLAQPASAATASPLIVKLLPESVALISVNGFCLNRGLPFPGDTLVFQELASAEIRQAISYGLEQGYVDTDLYALQLAIWSIANGPNPGRLFQSADQRQLAATIEQSATNYTLPTISSRAVSLEEAITEGLLIAEVIGFSNLSDPPYYGEGILTLRNLSDKELTIALPVGMRFRDIRTPGVQDMGIYATTLLSNTETSLALTGIQSGTVGLPGPRGPQGRQGERGPTGPAGVQGSKGEQGAAGQAGVNCWDRNGNGLSDPNEDYNGDDQVNVADCEGATGPVGPIGTPGENAIVGFVKQQRISRVSANNAQSVKLVSVECPTEMVVTGGGASVNSALLDDPYLMIQQSYPSSQSAWTVTAVRLPISNTVSVNWSVTAWAICVEIAKP